MYAILKTGGKQYMVQEGDVISIEKLEVARGEKVLFDEVLVVSKENNLQVGTPVVNGVNVEATVMEQGKDKKVIVFKYKSKKDFRKKQGHRQPFTRVRIDKINA